VDESPVLSIPSRRYIAVNLDPEDMLPSIWMLASLLWSNDVAQDDGGQARLSVVLLVLRWTHIRSVKDDMVCKAVDVNLEVCLCDKYAHLLL
jgi:hypothetical protein